MTKIARKLTDLVGNTPLMELSGYSGKYGLEQNIPVVRNDAAKLPGTHEYS